MGNPSGLKRLSRSLFEFNPCDYINCTTFKDIESDTASGQIKFAIRCKGKEEKDKQLPTQRKHTSSKDISNTTSQSKDRSSKDLSKENSPNTDTKDLSIDPNPIEAGILESESKRSIQFQLIIVDKKNIPSNRLMKNLSPNIISQNQSSHSPINSNNSISFNSVEQNQYQYNKKSSVPIDLTTRSSITPDKEKKVTIYCYKFKNSSNSYYSGYGGSNAKQMEDLKQEIEKLKFEKNVVDNVRREFERKNDENNKLISSLMTKLAG